MAYSLMVESMNYWETMIKQTVGCLVPEKSSWYLIDFVWKKGKFQCCDPMMGSNLTTTTKTGEVISLKRLRSKEAMEMLGIRMAPDGNNVDQIKAMKAKTKNGPTK